eukprot:7067760-Pyramimonas_sp.AAC.1
MHSRMPPRARWWPRAPEPSPGPHMKPKGAFFQWKCDRPSRQTRRPPGALCSTLRIAAGPGKCQSKTKP